MTKFNAQRYKKTLQKSNSITDCNMIEVPADDEPYIFISYSHKDYRQVYADLADLHESGIRFWYDTDLAAGINWDDGVRKRLTDPKCRGVIFYLSDNSLRSQAIRTEISIVLGEDSSSIALPGNLDYFAVNLTSDSPSDMIERCFSAEATTESVQDAADRSLWKNMLKKAFPDKQIFLVYEEGKNKKRNYLPKLIQNISNRFNVYPDNDPYRLRSNGADLISGHARINYADGAEYDGEFFNNRLHNHGTLRFTDGTVYTGSFQNGQRHGYGEMVYPDGKVYRGDWKNGIRHGHCITQWPNGMIYEGECYDDKICGQGTFTQQNGNRYTGSFINNVAHGKGVITSANGDKYEGDFINGNFHGKGVFTFANGDKYEGDFINGKFHGKGIYTKVNGASHSGDWVENNFHGYGTATYIDGSVYDGEWNNNKRHGKGIMRYQLPCDYDTLLEVTYDCFSYCSVYDGEWYNDKRHGIGAATYPDGDQYEGEWKHDSPNGSGTYLWKQSGDKYTGEWSDGPNGHGTYFYPDGESHSGYWIGGRLFEGSGVIRYKDGSWYRGEILNYGRNGRGVYTLADGSVQSGQFENDVFIGETK